ncbi:hypothetical protein [Paenibacillus sp. UNC451MF]|uniref:hypothetical protein n=1 Tax=Paenibacillus sp. UNC451MF TaxID=1449063 RepID=UPI00068CDF48|nr:hypothetical protein [Paenibacillus sp. UNC451MF]
MKRYAAVASICLLFIMVCHPVLAEEVTEVLPSEHRQDWRQTPAADGGHQITPQAYRSGRGSYSGVRNPGGGTTTTPNRNPSNVTNNPRTTPNTGTATRGGWGGIFGGFAAGALIGSLFNPFGFMGFGPGAGTPFSFIGLIFWAVIIYVVYRLFTRSRRNHS